jgi:pilus assembly protein CpaB
MKPKTIVPLVIGLGVGFFAIKMGVDMVQRAKGAPTGERLVLISSKQIEVGTRIVESMLGTRKVPEPLIPGDAFTESKNLLGRVTAMTIAPGVPITSSMLAPPGSEPGLRAIIPEGMRAVSVSVNEETAVAGFIMPGCRVDVSAVSRGGGPSRLILSDVEVGAVGQSMSRVGEDGKTVRMEKSVTLFIKPEEVQVLHQYTGTGRIRLALRGSAGEARESAMARFLNKALAAIPTPPPPSENRTRLHRGQHVVDLIRGQEYEKIVFESNGVMRRYHVETASLSPGMDSSVLTNVPSGAPMSDGNTNKEVRE